MRRLCKEGDIGVEARGMKEDDGFRGDEEEGIIFVWGFGVEGEGITSSSNQRVDTGEAEPEDDDDDNDGDRDGDLLPFKEIDDCLSDGLRGRSLNVAAEGGKEGDDVNSLSRDEL